MREVQVRSGTPEEADFTPYGNVRDAMLCHDPEVVLSGPADTGKTIGMLYKIHFCALKYPGASIVIVRKVLSDVYSTVLETYLKKVLVDGDPVQAYGGNKPQWFDYANGSRVWVAGLDKPGKILSGEYDMIYVNQVESLALADWEILCTRTTGRAGHMPYAQAISDCNPSHNLHWILSRKNEGKLTFFEAVHQDNPQLWDHDKQEWTTDGKKRLERLRNLTGSRYQRLYLGLWAPPEGAIYDVFDEARHKVRGFSIPVHWPRFVGVDPFGAQIAALWIAFDPTNMVLNVYREYVQPFGVTTPDHVREILNLSKREMIQAWVGGGPSERQARADWHGAGIPLQAPPITEVWSGIDRVYNLLKEFRLVIHDGCVNLLSEVGSYARKQNKATGEFTDSIVNKDSFHCLDALRYIIAFLSQPMEQREVINKAVRIGVW